MEEHPIIINIQKLVGEINVSCCSKLTEQQTLEIQNQVTEAILKAVKCAREAIAEGQETQLKD
ncbi:MAG: hypothetical protein H3C41_09845 [Bacteroidales bacterium]|nr:hypothetical protein [Bacteroidales bacterium]